VESNPYETPRSELVATESGRRAILWKIYFFIISILCVFDAYFRIMSLDSDIYDVFSSLANAVGVLGLFGYAFSKQIFSPRFWSVATIFVMTEALLNAYLMEADLLGKGISLLIPLPMYVGIFLYGRQSNSCWSSA
jgi:hypothetical protein